MKGWVCSMRYYFPTDEVDISIYYISNTTYFLFIFIISFISFILIVTKLVTFILLLSLLFLVIGFLI